MRVSGSHEGELHQDRGLSFDARDALLVLLNRRRGAATAHAPTC